MAPFFTGLAKNLGGYGFGFEKRKSKPIVFGFYVVSAPGPSGDTGGTIDLESEPDNQFTFASGSTYTLSFDRSILVDWEILGGGGNGGNGGRGSNSNPEPGLS